MFRVSTRRLHCFAARRKPDCSAAAVPGRRSTVRALLMASLLLVTASIFSGSAGSRPASHAPAEVGVSFAPMPYGVVKLETAGTTAECVWNQGGDCISTVAVGADVTLTAAQDPDSPESLTQRLFKWSTPACGTEPKCELKQVSEEVQAFALFTPALFQVRAAGAGFVKSEGDITLECEFDPAQAEDCSPMLDAGKSFTLRATPTNPTDTVTWVFGCDPGDDPHSSTCRTRTENRVVGVRFGAGDGPERPFDVSVRFRVTKGGSGAGSVTGASIDCGSDCTSTLGFGERLQLTATAASGSRFSGWAGAPCADEATCTLNAGPVTGVRAMFEPLPAAAQVTPAPPASPASPTTPSTAQDSSPTQNPSLLTPTVRAKSAKLAMQVLRVSSERVGSRYRVVARIQVNKRANARVSVGRGKRLLGERIVPLGAGRTKMWVALRKATLPGRGWVSVRVRDADGQIVTTTRKIQLGR